MLIVNYKKDNKMELNIHSILDFLYLQKSFLTLI